MISLTVWPVHNHHDPPIIGEGVPYDVVPLHQRYIQCPQYLFKSSYSVNQQETYQIYHFYIDKKKKGVEIFEIRSSFFNPGVSLRHFDLIDPLDALRHAKRFFFFFGLCPGRQQTPASFLLLLPLLHFYQRRKKGQSFSSVHSLRPYSFVVAFLIFITKLFSGHVCAANCSMCLMRSFARTGHLRFNERPELCGDEHTSSSSLFASISPSPQVTCIRMRTSKVQRSSQVQTPNRYPEKGNLSILRRLLGDSSPLYVAMLT